MLDTFVFLLLCWFVFVLLYLKWKYILNVKYFFLQLKRTELYTNNLTMKNLLSRPIRKTKWKKNEKFKKNSRKGNVWVKQDIFRQCRQDTFHPVFEECNQSLHVFSAKSTDLFLTPIHTGLLEAVGWKSLINNRSHLLWAYNYPQISSRPFSILHVALINNWRYKASARLQHCRARYPHIGRRAPGAKTTRLPPHRKNPKVKNTSHSPAGALDIKAFDFHQFRSLSGLRALFYCGLENNHYSTIIALNT